MSDDYNAMMTAFREQHGEMQDYKTQAERNFWLEWLGSFTLGWNAHKAAQSQPVPTFPSGGVYGCEFIDGFTVRLTPLSGDETFPHTPAPTALQLLPYYENQVTLINGIPLDEYKAAAEQLAGLVPIVFQSLDLYHEQMLPSVVSNIKEVERLAAIVAGGGE